MASTPSLNLLVPITVIGLTCSLNFLPSVWGKNEKLQGLQKQYLLQQKYIHEQEEILEQQDQVNKLQQQEIQKLKDRLKKLEAPEGPAPSDPTLSLSSDAQILPPSKEPEDTEEPPIERGRDPIGDLNTDSVQEGDFPGSIRIPGLGAVSFALGGFVKTAAIVDTNLENGGAGFLPAQLGTQRNDKDGNFSIDATTTRLSLDARAPVRHGTIRGYLEFDLNDDNDGTLTYRIRHAKGIWQSPWGTLTAGQSWTTLTDVRIIPEGVLEPTISGSILQRQPLIRWSQPLDPQTNVHVALEDPNSDDVFNNQGEFGHTPFPDVVLAGGITVPDVGYFRLSGIYRRIKIDKDDGGDNTGENGWGISTGINLKAAGNDKVILTATYGKGLGRYLIGLTPASSGTVDPAD